MTFRFLYFDLGNVLLGFSHERMCQQLAEAAGASVDVVHDLLFADDGARSFQWQYEVGQLTTDDYYEYFCRQTGTRPERLPLQDAACDIFWPLDDSWRLVEQLAAAGHRLGIMSNINPIHWQFVTDGRFPLLASAGTPSSRFVEAILSFEARSMKPDRRIYELAVERAGVPADEVFFVDDREDNVAGAIAAGLDAVQFTTVERLIGDLAARGVTLPLAVASRSDGPVD